MSNKFKNQIKPKIEQYIKKNDEWFSIYGFISKTGMLLIFIGLILTFISFWLGVNILMFIPAFVLSVFIYSFLNVYFLSKRLTIIWQKVLKKIHLKILWNKKIDYAYFKLAFKNHINTEYLIPDEKLIFNSPYNSAGRYYFIIQGRLDVFRKVIKLDIPPSFNSNDIKNNDETQHKDQYFFIKPYEEGDDTSRIDALQTCKRNRIHIREKVIDLTRRIKEKLNLKNFKIILDSNYPLSKRTDLERGPILEWILIGLGLVGIQLEWNNYMFLFISIISLFFIYITNKVLKLKPLSRKGMNIGVVLLFILFILESILTYNLIESGIHFLALNSIFKHRFKRERRDAFTYLFLVLFIFVTLSFFTLRIWFLGFFISYLLLAVGILSTYAGGEMKKEYSASFGRKKTKRAYVYMNIFIFILTISLFFLLPHGDKPRTPPNFIPGKEVQETGFSEEVSLDNILNIKKNFSKQFIIENAKKEKIPEYQSLYWRGMRFTNFENQQWKVKDTHRTALKPLLINRPKTETWNIKYFPNDSDIVFLPKAPLFIYSPKDRISFEQIVNDRTLISFDGKIFTATNLNIIFLKDSQNKIIEFPSNYNRHFYINANTKKLFKNFWNSIPRSITKNPKKISDFIEKKAGFEYSLEKPAKDLESFLYNEKQGHCEYFATVLALTLQNFGFEATLVNGFYGGEFNELSNNWVVRGEHAHSWVEVYDKDTGLWQIFDATPTSEEKNFWFKDNDFFENTIKYYDFVEYYWYRYVVQFDIINQEDLWSFLFKIFIPIISSMTFFAFLVIYGIKIFRTKIKIYFYLSPKQKFTYWLSKKTQMKFFVLEKIKKEYPALVKKTQNVIYGNNKISKKDLKELKEIWKKEL